MNYLYHTALDLGYRHKPEGFFVVVVGQDIFIEQLLCTRHCAGHWDMVVNRLTWAQDSFLSVALKGSLAPDQCICLPSGTFLILGLCSPYNILLLSSECGEDQR